jgi:uncharacterized membrane protein
MKEKSVPVKTLTATALLMAMNIIMSTSILSVPVPGGHMYLNDVVIVTAAILLPPFYAFLVGGVGAFIGDMLFYPAPMFVSLVVHGLQAVVISLFVHRWMKDRPMVGSVVGAVIGWVITFVGYTLGRAFIYSTPAYAMAKLPFQILQTAVGSAIALFLCWGAPHLVRVYQKQLGTNA